MWKKIMVVLITRAMNKVKASSIAFPVFVSDGSIGRYKLLNCF